MYGLYSINNTLYSIYNNVSDYFYAYTYLLIGKGQILHKGQCYCSGIYWYIGIMVYIIISQKCAVE